MLQDDVVNSSLLTRSWVKEGLFVCEAEQMYTSNGSLLPMVPSRAGATYIKAVGDFGATTHFQMDFFQGPGSPILCGASFLGHPPLLWRARVNHGLLRA